MTENGYPPDPRKQISFSPAVKGLLASKENNFVKFTWFVHLPCSQMIGGKLIITLIVYLFIFYFFIILVLIGFLVKYFCKSCLGWTTYFQQQLKNCYTCIWNNWIHNSKTLSSLVKSSCERLSLEKWKKSTTLFFVFDDVRTTSFHFLFYLIEQISSLIKKKLFANTFTEEAVFTK